MENKKEFKWTLLRSGQHWSQAYVEMVNHLREFHLGRLSEVKVISYYDFRKMIREGEIAPGQGILDIPMGLYSCCCLTQFHQPEHEEEWLKMWDAGLHFLDGYRRCLINNNLSTYEV